jgi:hypothetical protein
VKSMEYSPRATDDTMAIGGSMSLNLTVYSDFI